MAEGGCLVCRRFWVIKKSSRWVHRDFYANNHELKWKQLISCENCLHWFVDYMGSRFHIMQTSKPWKVKLKKIFLKSTVKDIISKRKMSIHSELTPVVAGGCQGCWLLRWVYSKEWSLSALQSSCPDSLALSPAEGAGPSALDHHHPAFLSVTLSTPRASFSGDISTFLGEQSQSSKTLRMRLLESHMLVTWTHTSEWTGDRLWSQPWVKNTGKPLIGYRPESIRNTKGRCLWVLLWLVRLPAWLNAGWDHRNLCGRMGWYVMCNQTCRHSPLGLSVVMNPRFSLSSLNVEFSKQKQKAF